MKYFDGCVTNADVKARFREWCKKLHPDCGGSAVEFSAMKDEYEIAFENCKRVNRAKDGTTYERDTNETAADYMKAYEAIMRFADLVIELCGTWLWVGGNTKEHKNELKAAGFRWNSKKGKWSWCSDDDLARMKARGWHTNWTMEQIYNTYGREKLATEELVGIA